ncbi:MAG TPA: hypothetical protein VKY26_08815 [Actinomycetota bacterium]|nr:hypothetical protein [Actinomycetota bacterium]
MTAGRVRAVAAAAVAAAVAAALLGGCAAPRNSLGAGSTACFKALPPAFTAVGRQGRYLGVRQVSAATLAKRRPEFAALGTETICVVAFEGTYPPGSVKGAAPSRSGKYALVAIDAKTGKEVGAAVVAKLPLRFVHSL